MTWNDSFSVRSRALDAEHRQLFKLINELHDAMKAGQGSAMLAKVLDRLIQYTRTHFANEEEAMVKAGYADFLPHVAEHRKLTQQVEELSLRVKGGTAGITIEVMDFLQHWLTDHIMRMDLKYAPYLSAEAALAMTSSN